MQGAIQTALKIKDKKQMAAMLNEIAPDGSQWLLILEAATAKARAGDFNESLRITQPMNNFRKAMTLVVLAKEWGASNRDPMKGWGSDS